MARSTAEKGRTSNAIFEGSKAACEVYRPRRLCLSARFQRLDDAHAGLHIQIPLGCHAQIRLDQVRSERLDLFVQLQLPPSRCLSHSFQRCSIISCTDEADDAINVGPLAQMVHEKDAQAAGCTCDELCISAHSALRLIGQAR